MKWTTPHKVIAGLTALLALAIAALLAVRGINGTPVEVAEPVELPPDYVLKIEGRNMEAVVEKAFCASSHGGWHGDGTDVTAYQIKIRDLPRFLEKLKENTPGYSWKDERAEFSSIAGISRLFPDNFRPIPDERLLHGRPADGPATAEYYFNRRRSILYIVINTF
jgi:hypothetical protein